MRLRSRQSFIRAEAEPPRKKAFNFSRWLYLCALVLILVWLVFHYSGSVLYVTGYWQVILPKVDIQPLEDIRIKQFFVQEGQFVKAGDVLFTYTQLVEQPVSRLEPRDALDPSRQVDLQTRRAEREASRQELRWLAAREEELRKGLAELARDGDGRETAPRPEEDAALAQARTTLRANRAERWLLRSQFEAEQRKLQAYQRMAGSDACLKADLDRQQESVNRLRLQLEKSEAERAMLLVPVRSLLDRLEEQARRAEASLRSLDAEVLALESGLRSPQFTTRTERQLVEETREFRSKFAGTVTRRYKEAHEVALKGETVMDIYFGGKVSIKAFFDQSDLTNLQKGDKVSLEFPDGFRDTGVITRLYFATLPQPQEFQQKYEPVRRSVVADIEPGQSISQPQRWFYKMEVKVIKSKYY